MPLFDYDERREHAQLEAREAQEQREDREFDLRRYEPNEGFGPVFRAPDEDDEFLEETK